MAITSIDRAPDIEAVLRSFLLDNLAGFGYSSIEVTNEVPKGRAGSTDKQFIRILLRGGSRISLITDEPQVVVECWGNDDDTAEDMAAICAGLIIEMPHEVEGVIFTEITQRPTRFPDGESQQSRYTLTARFRIHTPQLARS
jgi:hypothetical protein